MQKGLLEAEDWTPGFTTITNPCWLQIQKIIDEFESTVQKETEEINDCIKELASRKLQLLKNFYKYKNSLDYTKQQKNDTLEIIANEKVKYFFKGYTKEILQIVSEIGAKPALFARMLAQTPIKKFENLDFAQSILYHFYPCYINPFLGSRPNNSLIFIEQVFNSWSYDISQGRPLRYSVIEQVLNGFNKLPQIACYVQKISMVFMKEMNKVKIDSFAFDQSLIEQQQKKKPVTRSLCEQIPKKNLLGKMSSFFFSKPAENLIEKRTTQYSQNSNTSDRDETQNGQDIDSIMKERQAYFVPIIRATIEKILKSKMPFLLKQMFIFFDKKIRKQAATSPRKLSENAIDNEVYYYRHYSYFLLTNLICEELHTRFASFYLFMIVHHEQNSSMKAANLHNFTEVIKIITQFFQGNAPDPKKYKCQELEKLELLLPELNTFYSENLKECFKQKQKVKSSKILSSERQEMRVLFGTFFQKTMMVSFNDIKHIVQVIKLSKLKSELRISEKCLQLSFLEDQIIKNNFDLKTSFYDFDGTKFFSEKIFFNLGQTKQEKSKIIHYYLGDQHPLRSLCLLAQTTVSQSKMKVDSKQQIESLWPGIEKGSSLYHKIKDSYQTDKRIYQVCNLLEFMKNLNIREMRSYILKVSKVYRDLYFDGTENVFNKIKQAIQQYSQNSLNRKSCILLCRDQILSEISIASKLFSYYTEQLRINQLYDIIGETFIKNTKIKAFLRIEKDEEKLSKDTFKIYRAPKDVKGINMQSLLVTNTNATSKKHSQDYILRTNFKSFTKIEDLIKTLSRNAVTKAALTGRSVEEFNEMFNEMCIIILSHLDEFIKNRVFLQNLNKDNLTKTIIKKIQDQIYSKAKPTRVIENDGILNSVKTEINHSLFFKKDLQELGVDWKFLIEEYKNKLSLMENQSSIQGRIKIFQDLFRMIFTIVGFTVKKAKISAEMINPIIQYLIVVSSFDKNHQILYSIQALKWGASPETSYNLTLYESSLSYVTENMKKDCKSIVE